MSPAQQIPMPQRHSARRGFYITAVIVSVLALGAIGVTRYFRLSSETEALRDSMMTSVPGHWQKTLALRVGFCTTALVRAVAQGFRMQPEAHAALAALRSADFGMYNLETASRKLDATLALTRADQAMRRRGWERIVGVVDEHELVAVYLPRRGISPRHLRCSIVVFQDNQLIVAGVRGNLEPLAKLAAEHLDLASRPALALR